MKDTTRPAGLVLGLTVLVAGCAQTPLGPTVQAMPGPGRSFAAFQADNDSCRFFAGQQVAGQADNANQRVVGTALLTTALNTANGYAQGYRGVGVATSNAADSLNNTLANGDLANAQMGIQQQYDTAFLQCMAAKGESVAGYPQVARIAVAPVIVADPMVRGVQRELVRLRYLGGVVDGIMGPQTSGAITSFESSNGLSVDGDASPRLLSILRATLSPVPVASAPAMVTPATVTSAPVRQVSAAAASPAWVAPVSASTSAAPSNNWVKPASP